jgi:K+ transporter
MQTETHSATDHKSGMAALSLGALGVVYGDIGTSPLYAFQTASAPITACPTARTTFWACCR